VPPHAKVLHENKFEDVNLYWTTPKPNQKIEEIKMKKGWIKVTEQLPQDKELVLIYNKSLEELHIGWLDRKTFKWGEHSMSEVDDKEITHWQPLPEDPVDD